MFLFILFCYRAVFSLSMFGNFGIISNQYVIPQVEYAALFYLRKLVISLIHNLVGLFYGCLKLGHLPLLRDDIKKLVSVNLVKSVMVFSCGLHGRVQTG